MIKLEAKDIYNYILAGNRIGIFYGEAPINAFGCTVHLWHETGGFRSPVMLHYHNLAGISCTRSWMDAGEQCFDGKTWEVTGGTVFRLVKGFRVYQGLSAFFGDYSRLIHMFYPFSADNVDCCWAFFWGLQHGDPDNKRKWATDPDYIAKLGKVAVGLAPLILGEGWHHTLATSAQAAIRRGVPPDAIVDWD